MQKSVFWIERAAVTRDGCAQKIWIVFWPKLKKAQVQPLYANQ